jgi:hypothetical protein
MALQIVQIAWNCNGVVEGKRWRCILRKGRLDYFEALTIMEHIRTSWLCPFQGIHSQDIKAIKCIISREG